MPKVSVIVPSYRHAAYLRQRLDSIIHQTFSDFELILLDDNSPDHSREILTEYAADPRASCHFNEVNSGSTFRQWNKGLSLARGEYIWIAESDDYADSLFLESTVRVLESNRNVGLVFCRSNLVDSAGRDVSRPAQWRDPRYRQDFVCPGRTAIREILMFKPGSPILNVSGVLFRASAFRAAGGANTDFAVFSDWCTYAQVLLQSDLAYLEAPLNYFRQHEATVRRELDVIKEQGLPDYVRAHLAVGAAIGMPRRLVQALAFAELSRMKLAHGLRREAFQNGVRAIASLPVKPYCWRVTLSAVMGRPI
jgi:glycosyltransferase involved in cell wall biosynthesis